jgi:hypothetical protein
VGGGVGHYILPNDTGPPSLPQAPTQMHLHHHIMRSVTRAIRPSFYPVCLVSPGTTATVTTAAPSVSSSLLPSEARGGSPQPPGPGLPLSPPSSTTPASPAPSPTKASPPPLPVPSPTAGGGHTLRGVLVGCMPCVARCFVNTALGCLHGVERRLLARRWALFVCPVSVWLPPHVCLCSLPLPNKVVQYDKVFLLFMPALRPPLAPSAADTGGAGAPSASTTTLPPTLPQGLTSPEAAPSTKQEDTLGSGEGAAAPSGSDPTAPALPPPPAGTGIRRVDSEERSIAAFMAHTSPTLVRAPMIDLSGLFARVRHPQPIIPTSSVTPRAHAPALTCTPCSFALSWTLACNPHPTSRRYP